MWSRRGGRSARAALFARKARLNNEVVDAFGSALLGKLVVFAQEARQPECLQVVGEQQLPPR